VKSLYHPGLGQQVAFSNQEVPEGGDAQTAAVIGIMSRYAAEDASSPEVQRDAQQAMAECSGCMPEEAVFRWIKHRLRFVEDGVTAQPFDGEAQSQGGTFVEALIRPRDMAVLGVGSQAGDCDDYSMYAASLLLALGVPVSFVTVAADPESSDFSHVYVAAYRNGVRVPLDTSHGPRPGWETGRAKRIKEWPVYSQHCSPLLIVLITAGAIGAIKALCR
jgi:hypothetical protein